MTPQFLRSEAARFREMAETSEREASKQRLLGMAVDYDARAVAADAAQPAVVVSAAEPKPEVEPEPEAPIEGTIKLRTSRRVPFRA